MTSILNNLLEKGVPTREFQLATTGESSNEPIKIEGGKEGFFFNADFVMVAGLTDTHACQGIAVDDSGRTIITGQGSRIDSEFAPVIIGGMDGVTQRSLAVNADGFLKIDLQNAALTATVNVDIDQSTDSVQLYGNDGIVNRAVKTDASGRLVMVGAAADGAAVAGNPVLIAGSDGTNAQSILTDVTGRVVMVGAAADGSALSGNPILIAGSDGTNAQSISTDATGRVVMVGAAADGAALSGNPVLMAGSDGTNAQSILTDSAGAQIINGKDIEGAAVAANPINVGGRYDATPRTLADGHIGAVALSTQGHVLTNVSQTISSITVYGNDGADNQVVKTDTSGRVVMVGAAADGAAVAGNPILMAGSDGTNAQSISTDATGRIVMVGAAADGAAVAGNPVLMAGSDGTNAQSILTDVTGRVVMVGAAADGAAVAGNPILIAGSDGTNAQNILTDSAGAQIINGKDIEGAPVTANPINVGGRYDATPRTLQDGDVGAMALSAAGLVKVDLSASNTIVKIEGKDLEQAIVTANPIIIGTRSNPDGRATHLASDNQGFLGVNLRGRKQNSDYIYLRTTDAGDLRIAGFPEGTAFGDDPYSTVLTGLMVSDNSRAVYPLVGDSAGRQFIAGAAASGAAVEGNPVLIGGSDGTNARTLATDASGLLKVTFETQSSWFKFDLNGTAQTIINLPARIFGITIANEDSSAAFLNFYNDVAGSILVGTTPPDHQFPCLPGSTVHISNLQLDFNVSLSAASLNNTGVGSGAGVYVTVIYWYNPV